MLLKRIFPLFILFSLLFSACNRQTVTPITTERNQPTIQNVTEPEVTEPIPTEPPSPVELLLDAMTLEE